MSWLLFVVIVIALAAATALLVHQARAVHRDRVVLSITFPYGLDGSEVAALVDGLASLSTSSAGGIGAEAFVFEVEATAGTIEHRLVLPSRFLDATRAQLRAAIPAARVRVIDDTTHNDRPEHIAGVELGLARHEGHLRTDNASSVARALLAAMQPLQRGERLRLQWMVRGCAPSRSHADRVLESIGTIIGKPRRSPAPPHRTRALGRPVLAVGRLSVGASDRVRAQRRVRQLTAATMTSSTVGAQLRRRQLPNQLVAQRSIRRTTPLVLWPATLEVEELVGLLAWPLDSPQLPGLHLGAARLLAPSESVPAHGCVIGRSNSDERARPIAIAPQDRLLHLMVVGGTGSGKSTLLEHLVEQDMRAGRGTVVIDPKGDLVRHLLDRVSASRRGDVVLLDPTDEARPVGLNPLARADGDRELAADQLVACFHSLYRSSWGPRLADLLHAGLLTLMLQPGATLIDLPRLFSDEHFRASLLAGLDDPVGLELFWAGFNAWSPAERATALAPLGNKLRSVLLRRRLRNVLGQSSPSWQMSDLLARRGLLLVPLPKGVLGPEAAHLFGALVIAELWNAVQARAALPESERPLVTAYIDEVQDFLSLPTSLDAMFNQARGLGLGLTVAHQHIAQLTPEVRASVLANARSKIAFGLGADDARLLARDFGPQLEARDLQGLGNYEIAALIARGSTTLPPVTATTLAPSTPLGSTTEVRERSRNRFGVEVETIEASMRVSRSRPADEETIGVRRRRL